ncbi:MAG: DUF5686 and carboxypeptidase regulatory-like domain-containing protein [Sphingobacterium sp.]|jgi:hypothetical protein|nr:DUF5686 and carboxypeptidase regulatory-like domain-containing protein [Sphingobacterium sp.]
MRYYLIAIFFLYSFSPLLAQHLLKGKVTSSLDGMPLLGVTVKHLESNKAVSTDKEGNYAISIKEGTGTLSFTAVGYKKQLIPMSVIQDRKILNISLEGESQNLDEVVVTAPKKKRYRNKNNPMVELIRLVIQKRDENNALHSSDATFSEYEKLSMSLGILNEKAADSWILKKFDFLKSGLDTVKLPGRSLVPIFMNEKSGMRAMSSSKGNQYTLLGENQSRIDQYIDEDGIDEFLDRVYGMTDIYENDVAIGNRRFLSPIATLAPSFYKYYLVDTLKDSFPWRIKMRVEPRNREDALFSGNIYINMDGSYALSKAELRINPETNINWVKSLQLDMNYEKNTDNKYFLNRSVVKVDLGIFKKGMDLFGEKVIIRNPMGKTSEVTAVREMGPANDRKKLPQLDWNTVRPEKLSFIESQAFRNIDSLKKSRRFRKMMSIGSMVTSGYIDAGWFEIGSFPTFYSFNSVEGSRFKFGGNTTDLFSKRLILEGYGAYGTKDKKAKFNVAAIYSLNGTSVYKYPIRSITARAVRDIRVPGQELNFFDSDNFLLSFRRGENDKMFYYDKQQVEYQHELENHVSLKLGVKRETVSPGGILSFPSKKEGINLDNGIKTAGFTGEFRWAPGEKIYQGKRYRRIINIGMPIFTLSTDIGVKGLLGGEFNYQRFVLSTTKRFFLSQFGYSDVVFENGIQFGKVPYPLMIIHRANQSYAYQLNSFNLMNAMEFMSDRYSSLQVQHAFNGFVFNKIPLLKKLDLRELVSLKVLYGNMSHKNRYGNDRGENFPDTDRTQLFRLNRGPYIEGGVGISNIFKVLRVDVVRRFTYLDNPAVSKWGIRAKIGIDF